MAENIVINNTTYNGVDTLALVRSDGTAVTFYPDAVRYNAQNLTEAQKAKARENIGAIGATEIDDVIPTASVSKSGKAATISITDKNGTKTVTINDGVDGNTPVKGTDYYTEAEKAEFSAYIASELAKREQLEPMFANSIDECTDTTKMYVLPDGYIYAHMGSLQYPFTNQIPLSINSDKTTYVGTNGEKGYKVGYSLISSGVEATRSDYGVTGFIPIKKGDVIRFHNFDYVLGGTNEAYFALYKADFSNKQAQIDKTMTTTSISYLINNITVDSANRMTGFTVVDKYNDGITYLRISAPGLDSSTIVTVNEEIVDPTWVYMWKSTGHQFVPADYEDRIIPLEKTAESHEKRIKALEVYGSDSASGEDIPAYIKAEADGVLSRIIEQQGNRNFTMVAMSDFHYSGTGDNKDNLIRACKAISYMGSRVHIDAIATLGDNLPYGESYDDSIRANADRWLKEMNEILSITQKPGVIDFRTPGNHDRFGTSEKFMPDNAIYSFISGYNRQCDYVNSPIGYAYKDFNGHNLRVIVLNTAETEGKGRFIDYSGYHISTKQYKWLIDTLDMSNKPNASDWRILILSHHRADDYQQHAKGTDYEYILPNILNAYNTGGSYSAVNVEDSATISCNFAGKNAAKLIGQIHGHHHDYEYGKLLLGDGKAQTSVYAIGTPTTGFITDRNGDNDGNTYSSVKDTAQETAFCVYSIDLDNHVIHAIHYGNGIDREIHY